MHKGVSQTTAQLARVPFVTDPRQIGVQIVAAPGGDLRLLALATLVSKPR